MMLPSEDEIYRIDGYWYLPVGSPPLAAGPFLPSSKYWVERYLKLPAGFLTDRYVGGPGIRQARLAAARIHGNSMIGQDVMDGDIAIFQRRALGSPENKIVVIERIAEEGFGAWALKKLVIEKSRFSYRTEYDDEIDWDDPEIVLRSDNPLIGPSRLDPSGQYRIHGVFRRSLRPHDASLIDPDLIRRLLTGEETSGDG
jgi:Peptidase S24-like